MASGPGSGSFRDDAEGVQIGVPKAEDGRVLESIGSLDWTAYEARPQWAPHFAESAETSFLLPITSESLYLLSRGSHQSGKIEVKQSQPGAEAKTETETERGAHSDVRVDVRVAYHDQRALARATVCRLRKSGNRHGVGIYTPIPSRSRVCDQLYFEVVFTFPGAPSERAPLRIREFTTHTSNYVHEIGDLWESLLFENVAIDASNAAIHAESITLKRGTLISSNGSIVGHFNTSNTLLLHTSNGRIRATASLLHKRGDPTKLEMQTSNGAIAASISLATESNSGGTFVVNARSSNGAVDVRYDDAPAGSRLVSDARTANGVASVAMHPAFEGTYDVETSNARAVVRDTRPVDPEGRGRRRVVQQTTVGARVHGSVRWTGEERGRGGEGVSTVCTSNARACLDL